LASNFSERLPPVVELISRTAKDLTGARVAEATFAVGSASLLIQRPLRVIRVTGVDLLKTCDACWGDKLC